MTNKEWLATLTDEQFYDEWKNADSINTRTAMIKWLGSEHNGKIPEMIELVEQMKKEAERFSQAAKELLDAVKKWP